MTIRYQCEECGAALNINDELAGTEGNCPRCQVQFVVPDPVADAVPQPAGEVRNRKAKRTAKTSDGGPLSDDEIGDLLNADAPPAASSDRRVSVADSDADLQTEEEQDDEGPRRERIKKRPVEDDAEDSDEEIDEAESEKPSRKQKSKRAGPPAVKPDSTESASIARNLMGRGAQPVERDETEKRKRRPFGGRDESHPGEISSRKQAAAYILKLGWPYVAGIGVFLGLCIWLGMSMMKHFVPIAPLAPVSGTVTLDGKPLSNAIVRFVPQVPKDVSNDRLGSSDGFTDAEGKYALTYTVDDGKPIMGAIIGPHMVQIQLNDITGAQRLPPIYSTYLSTLKADVAKGKGPYDFALKSEPEPGSSESQK